MSDPSVDRKKAKKEKKEKKRKHEEQQEEAAGAPIAAEAPQAELSEKEKKKAAKRAKKEAAAREASASSESTSDALASLAAEDEMIEKDVAKADGEDEPFDLSALKKNKSKDVKNGSGSSSSSSSDNTIPEGATVIRDPVRIFLGNLPFKITDELIHECFDEFGTIEGIHWVTDKETGRFYGTAFVDFADAASAKAAQVRNGVEILGRPIKVGMAAGANIAGKNRFNSKEKKGGHLAKLPISAKPEGCTTVFLGNLSFNIDDTTIAEVFKHCGDISDIRWVEKDGEFKGCGFIEFYESWQTDEAVKLNGKEVMGRPMRVDYSARASRQ